LLSLHNPDNTAPKTMTLPFRSHGGGVTIHIAIGIVVGMGLVLALPRKRPGE
tara:strand:- start:80 stop:235 length:156 start_codon:yes stop_codon:yes gene_type:complete